MGHLGMSGPIMPVLRAFLADCTAKADGSNVLARSLLDRFNTWCEARGHPPVTIRQFVRSMGYAGHRICRLDLGSLGFRGIYISGGGSEVPTPYRHHLSSLGLAGLHLEMASGHVASLIVACRRRLVGVVPGRFDDGETCDQRGPR